MPFKVTFFFTQPEESLGWSEVHYAAGADFPSVQLAARQVANVRTQILASPCTLDFIRVSGNLAPTTPMVRRQRLASLTAPALVGSATPKDSSFPDVAWTAVKVRLTNTDGTIFRIQLLRGVPDSFWSEGNDVQAGLAMRGFVKAYLGALQAANFQGHHIVRGNPAGIYYSYGQCIFEGMTRRATGRPSYLPRGRRSKKKA